MPDPRSSIETYFQGERAETIAVLVFALVLLVTALLLWTTRDAFARPLAIVLLMSVGVACSVTIPLLLRDGPHKTALLGARSARRHTSNNSSFQHHEQ